MTNVFSSLRTRFTDLYAEGFFPVPSKSGTISDVFESEDPFVGFELARNFSKKMLNQYGSYAQRQWTIIYKNHMEFLSPGEEGVVSFVVVNTDNKQYSVGENDIFYAVIRKGEDNMLYAKELGKKEYDEYRTKDADTQ